MSVLSPYLHRYAFTPFRSGVRLVIFALAVFLLAATPASAQNVTWTGTTSTDWNTGTNWDSGNIPTANNTLIIDSNSGNQPVLLSGNATSGNIFIGATGASGANTSLTISNGGTLQSSLIFLGNNTGSTGSLLVTGPGTALIAPNISAVFFPKAVGINLGNNGTGSLTIANGAQVIGSCQVNNGSLLVTGDGTFLNTVGTVRMNLSANTTTTVSDGANFTTRDLLIGTGAAVTVTGQAASGNHSITDLTGDLFFLQNGTASLTISNGGQVFSKFGAQLQDGNATLVITDPGSYLNAGNATTATFQGFEDGFYVEDGLQVTVANGGNLTTQNNALGFFSNSTGCVTIEDSGSVWNATGDMYVGYNSGGNVTLANGGALVVTGGNLVLGKNNNSTGTLNLGDNSTVSITNGTIILGQNTTATGIVNLNAGSELSLGANLKLSTGSGHTSLNFAGGTLQAAANYTMNATTATTAVGGGAFIDTNGFNLTLSGNFSGTGNLTKLGAGTLSVRSSANISNLDIEAGTLTLDTFGVSPVKILGAISGNGTWDTLNILSIHYNLTSNTDSTFAGNLIGYGAINKLGLGTLTLTGNNSFLGSINVTAGTLVVADDAVSLLNLTTSGGNLDFAITGANATYTGTLGSQSGNITKSGPGHLSISSPINLNTGNLNVIAGTLSLNAPLFVSGGDSIILSGGNLDFYTYPNSYMAIPQNVLLGGTGAVTGCVDIQAGVLAVGSNGAGTLNFGDLLISKFSDCQFSVNDSGNFSSLNVTGNLTQLGNIVINLGSTLQVGTYQLITAKKRKDNFFQVSITGLYTGTLKTSGANSTGKISGATFTFNSSTGKFTVAVPYPAGAAADQKAWLNDNFTVPQLLNPAIAGNTATPANDGVPNLVKYAFNLDPWQNESAALPQPSVVGNNLVLTFTKYHPDVTYTVEASTDLVHWSTKGVKLKVVKNVVTATYPLPQAGPAYMHIVVKQ